MTDNTIQISNFDAEQLSFSDELDDKRSGIGYGDLPPLTQREGGKRLLDTDYLEVMTDWMDCYGVFPTFNLRKDGARYVKTDEINGYQVIIPLTSQETVQSPTDEEQTNINFFESFQNKVVEYMNENKDNLPQAYKYIPDDKMNQLVSPLLVQSKTETTNEKGKKVKLPDPTKPLHLYLPLQYYSKNDKIFTKFFGPGDREVDPLKYQKVRGQIQMVIRCESIYFGNKTSIKLRLVEANYKPTPMGGTRRRLGANTTPLDQDIPDPQPVAPQKELNPKSTYNPEGSPEGEDEGEDEGERSEGDDETEEPRRKPATKMIRNKKTGKMIECEMVDGKWRPVKK